MMKAIVIAHAAVLTLARLPAPPPPPRGGGGGGGGGPCGIKACAGVKVCPHPTRYARCPPPQAGEGLMRILVTNDDGIHAEGLDVCEKIARLLSDDVWVVAPEYDQSGVAHSLSLNDPLRLRQIGERRFAVRGTPTDCVIMGARHLLNGHDPDLVLSGVNRGRNAGEDVIYSGTIAGAMEGTVLGIPSVALSQSYKSRSGQAPHWDTSLRYGPEIIRKV